MTEIAREATRVTERGTVREVSRATVTETVPREATRVTGMGTVREVSREAVTEIAREASRETETETVREVFRAIGTVTVPRVRAAVLREAVRDRKTIPSLLIRLLQPNLRAAEEIKIIIKTTNMIRGI